MTEVTLPPLPFLPDNFADRARMVRWGTEIARAATLAERERCADLCDAVATRWGDALMCVEAIRKGE